MKQRRSNFLIMFSALLFVVMFVLSGMIVFQGKDVKKVYADVTEFDSQTQILDNEEIISSSLWGALKRFYNNNKTDEMPAIKKTDDDNKEEYLTINLFTGFPISRLDLSGQEIDSVESLGVFDLSSFDEIDLSNNQIDDIGTELVKLSGLKMLNLSYNDIYSFRYNQLHETCYKTNLENLDLSHNRITTCDLSMIESAEIDASHNEITKESLSLPNLLTVKVKLSYNYISRPDRTNENLDFGLQGAKNNTKYARGQTVEYYGIDEITNIKIYSRQQIDENTVQETLVKTLAKNDEPYTFGLGYYRLEFDVTTKTAETQDIIVYIVPHKPTIKMFRDGKELTEIEYTFDTPTVVKFYGEENAKFAYKLNNGELVENVTEVEIKNVGINVLYVYQIVDGCTSDAETIFLEYKQRTTKGWIFVIAGSAIFVVAFYFIIKYYPVLIKKHIGKNSTNKKNLD